ncbi:carbohydrate ABC transporter permease [Aeromicrobium sp.]|uniref:carbohydrate ABC transporter permease n=1 Tax=Aeromicrobium sp. TaxID=1871063 RepID=UPI002FCB2B86
MNTANARRLRASLLLLTCIPFVYPFIFLLGTAVKTEEDFESNQAGLPDSFTLDGLHDAWTDARLGTAFGNSLICVSIAVVLTVLLSAGGAFWFLRHKGRLAATLRVLVIAMMAVPLPAFIIPLFVQLSDWNLGDNLFVLGFVFAGWASPFGIYLTYTYMKELPHEVVEAAEIDGASTWQVFWHIMVPLSKPVLTTLAVFAFVWGWGDLLAGLVLIHEPELRPLTPATTLLIDVHSSNIPRSAAGVVIAMVPMLVVFLIGQRALVRGFVVGVGK